MGSLGLLFIYTIMLGLLELHFDFTVGELVERLIRFLTGSG